MRWLIALLAALLLVLQYRLFVSPDGLREAWRLRASVDIQQADNEKLRARNRDLEAEVGDLKQGLAAVEERARSELGMTRRDETFFQIAQPVDEAAAGQVRRDTEEQD